MAVANLGTHLKFDDFDPVRDDWWLVSFVESGVKHLYRILVELV